MAAIQILEVSVNAQLPSCPYGIKCYRLNVQHFRDSSHPGLTLDVLLCSLTDLLTSQSAVTVEHERAAEIRAGIAVEDRVSKRTSSEDVTTVDNDSDITEPPAKRPKNGWMEFSEVPGESSDLSQVHVNGESLSFEVSNPMGMFFTRTKGLDAAFNDRKWTRSMKSLLTTPQILF